VGITSKYHCAQLEFSLKKKQISSQSSNSLPQFLAQNPKTSGGLRKPHCLALVIPLTSALASFLYQPHWPQSCSDTPAFSGTLAAPLLKASLIFFSFFFVVLGFELRAYTLNHSIRPYFVMGFSSR
jgi:hypothetical protein